MARASAGYQLPATAARRTAAMALTVDAIVDVREDVVAVLELPDDRLLEHDLAHQRPVEVREAGDVVARALLRVLDGGVGLHDEGPVRGLGQEQLARGLLECPALQVAR